MALADGGRVLILSSPEDVHASVVSRRLEQRFGAEVLRLDLARLSGPGAVASRIEEFHCETEVTDGEISIKLEDLSSIWWRRPSRLSAPESVSDTAVRGFCEAELQSLVYGALSGLPLRIINNPFHDNRAMRKPYQLRVAQSVGFNVPRTLMTNDPSQVLKFRAELAGPCIYKTFTAPSWTMVETRLFCEDDLKSLESLRLAPAIFQQFIPAAYHVRIAVFGGQVYAAAQDMQIEQGVDHRLHRDAKARPVAIPPEVGSKIAALMGRLHLDYGCIDMAVNSDDEYWFLEINPSGQFLYMEIDCGLPVSTAMARLLVGAE